MRFCIDSKHLFPFLPFQHERQDGTYIQYGTGRNNISGIYREVIFLAEPPFVVKCPLIQTSRATGRPMRPTKGLPHLKERCDTLPIQANIGQLSPFFLSTDTFRTSSRVPFILRLSFLDLFLSLSLSFCKFLLFNYLILFVVINFFNNSFIEFYKITKIHVIFVSCLCRSCQTQNMDKLTFFI